MGIFDIFKAKKAEEPRGEEKEEQEAPVKENVATAPVTAAPTPTPAPKSVPKPTPASVQPQGLFARYQAALKKTWTVLNTDVRDLLKREGQLVNEEFADELFATLIKTDVGVAAAGEIRDEIKTTLRARVVHMSDVHDIIKAKFRVILKQDETPVKWAKEGPTVILVVGVNGSGKTTSIAKLAYLCTQQGKSVLLGAGDTFRAAAVEQLTIWAQRLGVEIITAESGSDPAAVAHRAAARAKEGGFDVCIIDTAGRLQTQSNLMQQLEKIHRVISKQIPDAPHEVLLVLDATAGQNAISQAQGFSQAAHCTGIVLAKLDGTAKGGVVIPIRQKFEIPVKFIGLGEQLDDFAAFQSDQFVDALFSEQLK